MYVFTRLNLVKISSVFNSLKLYIVFEIGNYIQKAIQKFS